MKDGSPFGIAAIVRELQMAGNRGMGARHCYRHDGDKLLRATTGMPVIKYDRWLRMDRRLRLAFNQLRRKLWVLPLAYGVTAVALVLLAATVDLVGLDGHTPPIDRETIEKLLSIIAANMLSVTVLAVTSMVVSYNHASTTATPRAFPLLLADDFSRAALSRFIGAFIFSVVALAAVMTGYYGRAGLFALFVLTIVIFSWVIVTFARWVDRIARLGLLGNTIDRVEEAITRAAQRCRRTMTVPRVPANREGRPDRAVYARTIGYVRHIDVAALQACAEKHATRITVAALPGTYVAPGRQVAAVDVGGVDGGIDRDIPEIRNAFVIGDDRSFDEDPRFGFVALSEIAARALSPGVNDPGTAIQIIGRLVRLFVAWTELIENGGGEQNVKYDRVRVPCYDRVRVPCPSLMEMFDDAFTAISRDGAGTVEVAVRLQEAFLSLASVGNAELAATAQHHSKLALSRAESALTLPEDLARARELAAVLGARLGGTRGDDERCGATCAINSPGS
jgi:uncharacterized membrane protein